MKETNEMQVKNVTADPSALGLLGLAIVTLVASSQKLGLTAGVSYILPWAIFLGAFAQLTASLMDFKKNNMFGATAFGGYAFFWLSVAMAWLIGLGVFGEQAAAAADPKQLGMAFLGYLIFTVYMTVGALTTNKVLFIIFFLIDLLFLGLFLSSFGVMHELTHGLAAWAELGISLFSFYGSAAHIINTQMGRIVLPLGKAIITK